jgi:hypothetical protein
MCNYDRAYQTVPVPNGRPLCDGRECAKFARTRAFLSSIAHLAVSLKRFNNNACDCKCDDRAAVRAFGKQLLSAAYRLFVSATEGGPVHRIKDEDGILDIMRYTAYDLSWISALTDALWTQQGMFHLDSISRLVALQGTVQVDAGAAVVTTVHLSAAGFLGVALATGRTDVVNLPATSVIFVHPIQ